LDALADLLETVHLKGSVYCRSELSAPWGMALPCGDTARFHVVRRGRCFLLDEAPGSEAVLLEAGDVVMLPGGGAHVLADDPASPATPLMDLIAGQHSEAEPASSPGPLVHGGGGERVTLICGYFRFDAGAAHPLLSVLPPMVYVRGEGGRARSWLESTLDLITEETMNGRPGGETLINRLTEALFIQVVRAHLEEQQRPDPSWLAGLRDPHIALALGLIHRDPRQAWTVDTLAVRVGMSRSAFSVRFRDLVGEPPLAYLTRWRMHVAANQLREGRLTLQEVAEAVGYQAEASFNKAFKRLLGVTPGAFRRVDVA
jgi:AraC-like DNA-binding protein